MTAAKVTTKVQAQPAEAAPTPAFALMAVKPPVIHLTDSAPRAMAKMTWLIRQGYQPENLECFNSTGMMNVTLVLGNPDPSMIEAAGDEIKLANDREAHQRELDIQTAARELVEAREKAERQAALQAKVAEAELALAALKAAQAVA